MLNSCVVMEHHQNYRETGQKLNRVESSWMHRIEGRKLSHTLLCLKMVEEAFPLTSLHPLLNVRPCAYLSVYISIWLSVGVVACVHLFMQIPCVFAPSISLAL